MIRDAFFDSTGTYRYSLSRTWDSEKPTAVFVMLNPSTANAKDDDPTIRRCIRFAQNWGYGKLIVVNLFALISSDPKKLVNKDYAVGYDNDSEILDAVEDADIVVAAWGCFKEANIRNKQVIELLRLFCPKDIYCLGVTKCGYPKHPLYIRADAQPILYKRLTQEGANGTD